LAIRSGAVYPAAAEGPRIIVQVALLTIGQAPRDDVVPDVTAVLGPGFGILQAGALDGLGRREIEARYGPGPDGGHLVTRLRDGSEVVIGKSKIVDRLQGCIDRLEDEAQVFVVLCTGTFPRFRTRRPVLEPDCVLLAAVQATWNGGPLGILIPIEEQRAATVEHWRRVTPDLAIAVASPYQGRDRLVQAAQRLSASGATMVVMNCMGFTGAMKHIVREVAGAPVLLPATLIGRFLAEVA